MSEKVIKIAKDLMILKSMAAWKDIESYMASRESKLVKSLVSKDDAEVRGGIKELRNFKKFLGMKLLSGAEALSDLKTEVEEI